MAVKQTKFVIIRVLEKTRQKIKVRAVKENKFIWELVEEMTLKESKV